MNAQELRKARKEIIEAASRISGPTHERYKDVEIFLDRLESLDAVQKAPANAFYEFTNLLDIHVKLRLGTQGRPVSEALVLDTIVAECLKRRDALGEVDK